MKPQQTVGFARNGQAGFFLDPADGLHAFFIMKTASLTDSRFSATIILHSVGFATIRCFYGDEFAPTEIFNDGFATNWRKVFMSRAQIDRHHEGGASAVSRGLMDERSLAALFALHLTVTVCRSTDRLYQVSGRKDI